jgi:hypothetical protein
MVPRDSFMAAHHRHIEQMVTGYYARQRRRQLMVFLFGYFDEAGKFHDPTGRICLWGFVSDGDHWNTFEAEWRALLAKHGLPAIHMASFYSQCRARGLDDTATNLVLTEFVDKIRERVQFGFGIAVDGKYFRHKFELAGKPPKTPNAITHIECSSGYAMPSLVRPAIPWRWKSPSMMTRNLPSTVTGSSLGFAAIILIFGT